MGKDAKVRGFTLVELLIALAIFGMLVGIAGYGFSLFSRHWAGKLGRFQQAQDQYQRLDLVMAALENTLAYVVRDAQGRPAFYFLGREEGLTSISMNPVFSVGDLAVIRVFREPSGSGAWNLVYEEASLRGLYLREASQNLPFAHRIIVLREVPDLQFRYFGWRSVEEKMQAPDMPEAGFKPQWFTEFDGLSRRLHPQRIAIRIGGSEAVVFVPDRADESLARALLGVE